MRLSTIWIIKAVGVFLLAIGLVATFYAPYEIFVYYIFSEGGQFHYDGFGMGSLWFAIVTVMNFGYYAIAVVCLPLGYGCIKLRRWALTLARLITSLWLFFGILLSVYAVLLFRSFLQSGVGYDQVQPLPVLILALVFLLVLPLAAVIFFHHKKIQQAFTTRDSHQYWTERYPFSLLAVFAMIAALIVVLHLAIFFQGVFPWFGRILIRRSSAQLIAANTLLLGGMLIGLVRWKPWARWGAIAYFALLLISSSMTFSRFNLYDILSQMQLPLQEMEVIENLEPLLQISLFGLTNVSLLLVLGLLISSGRDFKQNLLQ